MTQTTPVAAARPALTTLQQVVCAWPFVLVIVGGAIGGLCGGVAWAANTKIMSSTLAAPVRYGLCAVTGLVAAVVWFLAAQALTPVLASMFRS